MTERRCYAASSRRAGELSVKEAAGLIGASPATVREWAKAALAGEASKINRARRDVFGRYWVVEDEIRAFLEKSAQAATYF